MIDIHPYQYLLDERAKNPFFPLPADYAELTATGQKRARLTTLCKQNTPMEFVASWDLFRRLYLQSMPPGFFYTQFIPSPPFHFEAIHDAKAYAYNLQAAPRGFAKSVVIGTELPLLLLLTRPYIRITPCLATDKMVEARFDRIMNQITTNELIIEDFGLQKPKRGQSIWNRHHIQLNNGSIMEGFSVTGRKRGARPNIFILDDPEYDDESQSDSSSLIMKEKFETFLFRQVLPMLEKHSSIFWIGTMIGRRSFLYSACYGDDPRFKYWNRKVYAAVNKDPKNPEKVVALWDGKWDLETLKAKKLHIGTAAFMAEYQNDPTSSQARTLKIESVKNEYEIEDYNPDLNVKPLISLQTVNFNVYSRDKNDWVQKQETAASLYKRLFRIITFDTAEGLSRYHDYSCIACLGFDNDNCLWVLDMWMGRAKEAIRLNNIFRMGIKWQPRILGIESSSTQIEIVDSMNTLLHERREAGWAPRVVPVDYKATNKKTDKASRIATLEWRFETGKIKYPKHLANKWPIKELYAQTRDFTYDLALLPHDDALDTVAMGHYVIHSRGTHEKPMTKRDCTLMDLLRNGETNLHGVSIISGLNADEVTPEILQKLVDKDIVKGYTGEDDSKRPLGMPKPRKPYIVKRYRRPIHVRNTFGR